jgi:hypothetical protein
MEIEDYIITHLGEGKFQVKVGEDEVKEAGSNLCGMVRYTYFEDYTLPEIGWEVTRKQLMQDYLPKMLKDASTKFNPN